MAAKYVVVSGPWQVKIVKALLAGPAIGISAEELMRKTQVDTAEDLDGFSTALREMYNSHTVSINGVRITTGDSPINFYYLADSATIVVEK